jgi:hypothetical protein
MTDPQDLRTQFLWVVRAMLVASGATLAVGLLLHVAGSPVRADQVLRGGLVILMATPVVRTLIAVSERLRQRDRYYLLVTTLVLLELSLTFWYATMHV